MYDLETLFKGYPAYTRKASKQSLFYKEEYEKWIYAHKFERWVIGPKIGDENVRFLQPIFAHHFLWSFHIFFLDSCSRNTVDYIFNARALIRNDALILIVQ